MMNKEHIEELHPLELKVLLEYQKDDLFSTQDLVVKLNMVLGQANQSVSWLNQKNLIEEKSRVHEIAYELTSYGESCRDNGTPAEKLLDSIKESPCTLVEAVEKLGLDQKDVGSAFGILSKSGFVCMDEDKKIIVIKDGVPKEIDVFRTLMEKKGEFLEDELSNTQKSLINNAAKKRGANNSLFRRIEREKVMYSLSKTGVKYSVIAKELGLTGEELGVLTSEMLKSQSWKGKSFRKYNVELQPSKVKVGRRNSYSEFLQQVKDKLVGLGFEEFDGSLVQTEFWNSDALFMPQFHPARDIHDVYYIKNPTHAKEIEEPWLSNIAAAHENGGNTGSKGWNYKFDRDFTKRLILRSQGTVMSAKTLTKTKIPAKHFGILRVFRHDQIDATHLSDFYQTEGIIVGDDVNMKTLLGLLKVFAEELTHAEEVKYVPGYFPFTEPSVEVHIKHPQIGWMELGGSGIFRPEVTKSLGVDVPVAAWGIGIDRMATMQMEISDLRDLFTNDLEKVIYRKGVKI